jgi:hypothetical protein
VDCGTFIRRVGTFKCAIGVACSAFGELVVAACFEDHMSVFDADCDLSTRIELPCSRSCGVAIQWHHLRLDAHECRRSGEVTFGTQ